MRLLIVALQQWARDPKKVLAIKQMRGLVSPFGDAFPALCSRSHLQVFGGAPLNKIVGDSLASQGIALFTGYGR